MMTIKWQCYIIFLITSIVAEKKCPSQDSILPCRCLIKEEDIQIWCSHSDLPSVLEGLRSISNLIGDPIDELILENNYLLSLPGRTFAQLKVLRLMMRYNALERVSSDWLIGLEKSLMELFVVEPNLRSLPEDTLIHLNNLEAITIQSNSIKRFPIFTSLPKLKYLQLESLSLIELSPRNFKDLPALETIHVSGSPRLTRLEASTLQDLPRLSLANISYCGINWLHPRAIARLPNLKELSLTGNKIVDVGMVGRASRDLPQLEILRLDHNYINKLSEAAFVDLPSLKKLFLSNNEINELHYGAFHRVPKLKTLDLNRNMVKRVHPEAFLQHSGSGVEELSLVENDISHVIELRSLLDALPRLIFLDLSFNNLKSIPYGALRGHPTLERLHLDYNKINMIDNEAFMAMPALRELRLKNNSLSEILDGPLWNLPALKGLDLSSNFYRKIHPRVLGNLPSLRRIDLSNNDIGFIDPGSFLSTPNLEHINLSINALTNLHPATFRPLLKLYELDVNHNYLMNVVPHLPQGLEYLHLSQNKISAMPTPPSPDLDLPALRMLDLSNNEIQTLPNNALKLLPQLRRLYVGKNALSKLDENSFSGLARLEIMDLKENKLVDIHRHSFSQMPQLKELNLHNNRLDIIFPEAFINTPSLKKLDISNNKLSEIAQGLLDKTKELVILNVSHNFLVQLPPNLFALKNIKLLDLTDNRLKDVHSQAFNSLTSLRDLKLAENFLQHLKVGFIENLQHLRSLDLDSNELEIIEPNAIHALPSLKSLKLSRNKLRQIPNYALNNLPNLQIVELQENLIDNIGTNAMHQMPHLLMLNLSHNHLDNLQNGELREIKSLEMLDVSHNKISRVTASNLEKMEWLVELRMNDNNICAVHGAPFNGMPRLRVLNLRNNKMMSFPEQAMQKLRTNIAVLDLNGNPLACGCNLLWFQEWLQEDSSRGPKCSNGIYLRDVHMSRQSCSPEERNVELVAPGCEAELLTAPAVLDTSQVFSPWMKLRNNNSSTNNKNHIAPSPEESEYFYDEYVDYPFNETKNFFADVEKQQLTSTTTTQSPHYTSGDTPTIYAAPKNKSNEIPKEVSNSPSSSGFTFFGVPLPSINLNKFWGNNNKNNTSARVNEARLSMPVADRKMAIINKPPRIGARGGTNLPTSPQIETGGFIPLLPGSGGFKPIPNPMYSRIQITTTEIPTSPNTKPYLLQETNAESMGHPVSTPFTTPPRISTQQTIYFTSIDNEDASEQAAKIEEVVFKPKVTTPSANLNTEASLSPPQTIEIVTESIEETSLSTLSLPEMSTSSVPEISTPLSTSVMTLPPTTSPSTTTIETKEVKKVSATPLSALLVPGGQQEFKISGRPTITKVSSPHLSATAPLLSNLQTADLIETAAHSREPKVTQDYRPAVETSTKADTSWYFANYNKTNLEPFVGSVSQIPSCGQGQPQASFGFWFCVPGLILLIN